MARLALVVMVLAALGTAPSAAQVLRVSEPSDWESWSLPEGAVHLRPDGGIELGEFNTAINPLHNAHEFEHDTRERGTVSGEVTVSSARVQKAALYDGDRSTWWQPDPADPLEDWVVKVDLGRVVLLRTVRLVFPDTVGAIPFRDFSVFVSEGATLSATADLHRYSRVGTTTRPNQDQIVEYTLSVTDKGDSATGDYLRTEAELPFMPVQYLRFVPHQITADAALAEIELVSLGDNVGLRTFARDGSIRGGENTESKAPGLFDGTVDKYWNAVAAREAQAPWRTGGQWFEWDLGAAFWLHRIVLYSWDPIELGRSAFGTWGGQWGYGLHVSDGDPISFSGGDSERIRGPYDYEELAVVDNTPAPFRCIFDHQFGRRKVRYIFLHVNSSLRYGLNFWETFLYSDGHPAEVEITSDFIDMRSAKTFTNLSWDADVPPGTSIELRTKSGDEMAVEVHYYHKNGSEVTEAQYNRLPSVVRGPTKEVLREGQDWSGWSELYVEPGQEFQSPTPRRYVRIRLILSTDDPAVTPLLRSISLAYRDPLVRSGVTAEVWPREAGVGRQQEFTYRIRPEYSSGDRGFDQVLIPLPSEATGVAAALDGEKLNGIVSEFAGDTLRVTLPSAVRRDSLDITFTTRMLRNPTVLQAQLVHSSAPGERQAVKTAYRDALTVFLPAVPANERIIDQLDIAPRVVTPNADAVNDETTLTFALLKLDTAPEVAIYDLSGRRVVRLEGYSDASQQYTWDGTDKDGRTVPPGAYIWRVTVEAQIGTRVEQRLVHVAY